MLKMVVDSLSAVDEALHSQYEERDGKFHLKVSGAVDPVALKSALDKERDANKELTKTVKGLTKQVGMFKGLEGVDLTTIKSLLNSLKGDDKEARLIAAGKIDEVVEIRMENILKDKDGQIKKLADLNDTLQVVVLEGHLATAAAEAGAHKGGIRDAKREGVKVFTLNDKGQPVKLGKDGETPEYAEDGKTLYSTKDWMTEQKTESSHWFDASSSGGGADGDKGNGGASDDSLTPIQRINKARGL